MEFLEEKKKRSQFSLYKPSRNVVTPFELFLFPKETLNTKTKIGSSDRKNYLQIQTE